MANKQGLFVDSTNKIPICPKIIDSWDKVASLKEFQDYLQEFFEKTGEIPELISINHDLTDEHVLLELKRPTHIPIEYQMYPHADHGLNVAYYLNDFAQKRNLYLNRVCTHGFNDSGCKNIEKAVNEYKKMMGDQFLCYKMNWNFKE